jgi:hypothetical protein
MLLLIQQCLHLVALGRVELLQMREPVGCVVFCELSLCERFHRFGETLVHGVELLLLLLIGALNLLQLVGVSLQACLCSTEPIFNSILIRSVALHAR